MTAHEGQVIQDAIANLGVAETGTNTGPSVDVYLEFVGLPPGNPWCVAFVCYRVYAAAEKLGFTSRFLKTGSSSALFNWFKQESLLLDGPHQGAIAMLKGGDTGHKHTCIVEWVDYDAWRVHTIDGNNQDAVVRAHYAIADCDFGQIV